jgi:predicted membrane channel-forming protein YqfA (hemolysin III family)
LLPLLSAIKKIDWTHFGAAHTLNRWYAVAGKDIRAIARITVADFTAVVRQTMKLAGILFLLAGWMIVLSALDLLRSTAALIAFVLAGVAVECIGMFFLFRSHLPLRKEIR